MTSIQSKLSGAPPCVMAGLSLPAVAMIAGLSGAQANEPMPPCGSAIAILNEGKVYDAFDRLNGGGDRRLRFRLNGKEPCPAGACKAETRADSNVETRPPPREGAADSDAAAPAQGGAATRPPAAAEPPAAIKVEIVARAAAGDTVIATIDLAGRSASYCLSELKSFDATPAQRRDGCPSRYLVNFLAVKLIDGDGPFVRRDVSIQYVYRADAGAGSVDHCMPPAILDGMFRRRLWTVLLEDGAAYIGETDFPRDRRATVPADAPFATTVSSP